MAVLFVLLSVMVCVSSASDYYGSDYKPEGVYYGGKYAGSCGQDGIYYNDEYSFVQCAHNIAYMQPCAPGTRNSDPSGMQVGKFYDQAPMCDVNLVDYGYSVFNSRRYGGGHGTSGYGSDYSAPSKYEPSYTPPRYPKAPSYSSYSSPSYSKPATTSYNYGSYSAPSHYSSSSYKPSLSSSYKPLTSYKPSAPSYKPSAPSYKPSAPSYKPTASSYKPSSYSQSSTYGHKSNSYGGYRGNVAHSVHY